MSLSNVFLVLLAAVAIGALLYGLRRGQALAAAHGSAAHSRPIYHGQFLMVAAALPMLALLIVWSPIAPRIIDSVALGALPTELQPADELRRGAVLRDIERLAQGRYPETPPPGLREAADAYASGYLFSGLGKIVIGLGLAAIGFMWGVRQIGRDFRARNTVEQVVLALLVICATIAVFTTVGIVMSVLFETLRFFGHVSPFDFLFGLNWSPQTAIRADQVGSSGAFGAIPLFTGTILIMVVAMLVAGPIGLFAAIYMAEYASPTFRATAKPLLEVLAGIPTVVLGFFAALTVAPLVRDIGQAVGLATSSESALAAGLVMGIMIVPLISSLSDDVINAVPQSLRDGSYAMGATKSETIKKVVLPAALPGIVSAFLLGISRAIGETMIVVMAAGLAANLTLNPLEAVTTVTVQIASLLTGDQEFDSPKTMSAFALGFVLFFFTLMLNVIALRIVKKYREQYD
jgi:phosphate transport system permease protein